MYVATSKTIHYFCCVLASTSESKETRKSFSGSTLRPCCCPEMLRVLESEGLSSFLTQKVKLERSKYSSQVKWSKTIYVSFNFRVKRDSKSFSGFPLHSCCCPEMLRLLDHKVILKKLYIYVFFVCLSVWTHS